MSKYTTELRYICEMEAGLRESKGYNDIANIIANSRTKIFNFNYPIYDEAYRSVLETKILKHFYTREIGLETYGLWKLKLDTKLNEIMPYYNQLYKSQLLEFNPLYTHDLTREGNKNAQGDSSGTENTIAERDIVNTDVESNRIDEDTITDLTKNISDNTTVARTQNEVSRDKYSDTPQGSLQNIENDTYLTNARKITDDTTENTQTAKQISEADHTVVDKGIVESKRKDGTVNDDLDERKNSTNEFTNTEQYLEHIYGYMNRDASELLMKYRKTFLNIDLQIIDELEDLFMHLW